MKLNCVSVKGYEQTEEGLRLCIRAELDDQPSKVWSKFFHLTWHMSPVSKALPVEIKFVKNDILLYIPEADKITETVEALKNVMNLVNQKNRETNEEPSYNLHEVII